MKTAVLALALAASNQGEAFDLVCAGEMSSEAITGNTSKPYSVRYRVDLAASKYCEDQCATVNPIFKVDPGVLVFESIDKDAPSERVRKINNVSRNTGEHLMLYTSRSTGSAASVLIMRWRGTCERADFTGFPTAGAKF